MHVHLSDVIQQTKNPVNNNSRGCCSTRRKRTIKR
jgi:hypothetical protein